MADLDRDGKVDLVAAVFPQDVLWAPGLGGGDYGNPLPVLDREGGVLKTLRRAYAVHVADWDGDGNLDLFVRLDDGAVSFHAGSARGFEANGREVVTEDSAVVKSAGRSAPWICDWDHDGDRDLLICSDGGGIDLYRNVGTRRLPRLAAPVSLRDALPGVSSARFCVTDWNLDGLDDVLIQCHQELSLAPLELTAAESKDLSAAEREMDRLVAELERLNETRPAFTDEDFLRRARKRDEIAEAMSGPRAVRKRLREKRDGRTWTEIRLYLLPRLR